MQDLAYAFLQEHDLPPHYLEPLMAYIESAQSSSASSSSSSSSSVPGTPASDALGEGEDVGAIGEPTASPAATSHGERRRSADEPYEYTATSPAFSPPPPEYDDDADDGDDYAAGNSSGLLSGKRDSYQSGVDASPHNRDFASSTGSHNTNTSTHTLTLSPDPNPDHMPPLHTLYDGDEYQPQSTTTSQAYQYPYIDGNGRYAGHTGHANGYGYGLESSGRSVEDHGLGDSQGSLMLSEGTPQGTPQSLPPMSPSPLPNRYDPSPYGSHSSAATDKSSRKRRGQRLDASDRAGTGGVSDSGIRSVSFVSSASATPPPSGPNSFAYSPGTPPSTLSFTPGSDPGSGVGYSSSRPRPPHDSANRSRLSDSGSGSRLDLSITLDDLDGHRGTSSSGVDSKQYAASTGDEDRGMYRHEQDRLGIQGSDRGHVYGGRSNSAAVGRIGGIQGSGEQYYSYIDQMDDDNDDGNGGDYNEYVSPSGYGAIEVSGSWTSGDEYREYDGAAAASRTDPTSRSSPPAPSSSPLSSSASAAPHSMTSSEPQQIPQPQGDQYQQPVSEIYAFEAAVDIFDK
jgi:hypothetical protein